MGFASRQLAIVDLSPAGHQPMASAAGRYWITYHGEVHNFLELRAALERQGVGFRSRSDTEVILALPPRAVWSPDEQLRHAPRCASRWSTPS